MLSVTGLWKNKTKDGKSYLKGNIGSIDILIFPVENKKNDKCPDYNMCFSEHKKQDNANPWS